MVIPVLTLLHVRVFDKNIALRTIERNESYFFLHLMDFDYFINDNLDQTISPYVVTLPTVHVILFLYFDNDRTPVFLKILFLFKWWRYL